MIESFVHRLAVLTVLFGGFVMYIGSEPASPDLFVLGLLIALGGFLVGLVGLVIEARAVVRIRTGTGAVASSNRN